LRLREYLFFDSLLFKKGVGVAVYVAACILSAVGQVRRAFLLLSKAHRSDFAHLANRKAEQLARDAAAQARTGNNHPILALYQQHIRDFTPAPRTAKFFEDPSKLLGPVAMVLKSPAGLEKGVVLLQYSYTFPLFAHRFDLSRIASRYYIVLEPDWSGYCEPNILSYGLFPFPVFVQAFEPRDAALIANLHSNLVVVPTSTNWWVDHRLFRPLPGVARDIDAVMVASWGSYKRHYWFFRALGQLRKAGRRLRVLLLGYPYGMTREQVLDQAHLCGVADQLELQEWVPYEQVNEQINRARVNVLWSRREGVNRAIIEGMFAGVPCIVREGFNYGCPYPYINPQTGCFASEKTLPETLLRMIDQHEQFTPRDWVSAHMSCERSTQILADVIGRTAAERGEPWTGNLAVKVNKLHGMEYWDPQKAKQFEGDYEFLRATVRPAVASKAARSPGVGS
jgi:glycosyltransferase involved in cell wall biosynthesis